MWNIYETFNHTFLTTWRPRLQTVVIIDHELLLNTQFFSFDSNKVLYAIKEYAATATDVISRRLRLSFLNVQVCILVFKKIVECLILLFGMSDSVRGIN